MGKKKENEVKDTEKKEEKKEDLPSVSLDNKTVSHLVKEEEEEVIPSKFVPNHRAKKENKRELLVHNGRVYKKISATHGIWADNGQAFSLSTLK